MRRSSEILIGILSNNIFQAIWLCNIVAEPKHSKKKIIITIVSILTNTYALGNLLVWGLRAAFNLALLIPWLLFFRERAFQMYKEIRSSYGIMSAISIMCYVIQTLFWFYNMQNQNRDTFFNVMLMYACGLTFAMYLMIFRHMAQSDHTNRMKQL